MNDDLDRFWGVAATEVLRRLDATALGLASAEASRRLGRLGPNVLQPRKRTGEIGLLLGQFKSPIILILLFAAGLSFFLHDPTDALIILGIVLVSGLLGFWQERGAADAVEKLLAIVQTKATVLRDGAAAGGPGRGGRAGRRRGPVAPARASRATACSWSRRTSSSTRRR